MKKIIRNFLSRNPKLCRNFKSWILDNPQYASIIKEYYQAFVPEYSPPTDLYGRTIQFPQPQVGVYERYLANINDVTLYSPEGFLELPDKSFAVETAWIEDNVVSNPAYFKRFQAKPIYRKGKWFSCLLFWSSGYYHWFCDVLPRFHEIINEFPDDVRFVVPSNMKDWQTKSLELIGIPKDRWEIFDGSSPWLLEHLIYAPPVAMTGDHEAQSMKWVSKRLLQKTRYNLSSKSSVPRLNLWISRAKARCRRIVNEEELLSRIADYSFTKICAEDYSLEEQINLFSQSKMIISPHGAGLTNMLFCPPNTNIVEIFESSGFTQRRCYWSLANSLNHSYSCFIGEEVITTNEEADIFVPVDEFLRLFENRFFYN